MELIYLVTHLRGQCGQMLFTPLQHKYEAMINAMPPATVPTVRTVPTSETEVVRSAQNGLQVATCMNDSYVQSFKMLQEEYFKMKKANLRAYELFEVGLKATQEILAANSRLVASMDSTLHVEVTAVSIEEEQLIPDSSDRDHNRYFYSIHTL